MYENLRTPCSQIHDHGRINWLRGPGAIKLSMALVRARSLKHLSVLNVVAQHVTHKCAGLVRLKGEPCVVTAIA